MIYKLGDTMSTLLKVGQNATTANDRYISLGEYNR